MGISTLRHNNIELAEYLPQLPVVLVKIIPTNLGVPASNLAISIRRRVDIAMDLLPGRILSALYLTPVYMGIVSDGKTPVAYQG